MKRNTALISQRRKLPTSFIHIAPFLGLLVLFLFLHLALRLDR